MKFLKHSFLSLVLLTGLMMVVSCEEDTAVEPQDDIVTIAQGLPELSSLVSILSNYPDLVSSLSAETGTFTVFAPTNDAFAALLDVIGQSSVDDIPEELVRSILEYHVLASEVYSGDLSDGLTVSTLNGESITVSMSNGSYSIDGAGIVAADVDAANGVVHIVNSVLVPVSIGKFVNTIMEPAVFNKNFSTLVAAVKAASPTIEEILLSEGPSSEGMTLFAPTNAAFEAAGITSLPDEETLNAVLAYHLFDGIVPSTALPMSEIATPVKLTSVGGDLYLTNLGSGVFLNGDTEVIATDIYPNGQGGNANGVVHVIDNVLLPPSQDIVAIAIDNGFNELAAALTRADLVNTLQSGGPYTVFAPTDQAFQDLYAALGVSSVDEIDVQTLTDVLLYHVLDSKVFSSDLADGIEPASLSSGATFTINLGAAVTISDNNPENSDASVTAVNILGTNGVIHVIDQVILP